MPAAERWNESNWKNQATREALSFPVGARPVYAQKGGEYVQLGRQVTWNQRDDTSLEGYVTDRYHILTHQNVFESIDLVTKNLGLKVQKERILTNKNMSRMTAYITLDGQRTKADITRLGPHDHIKDDWDIGFSVGNALDGSGSIRLSPYIERLVCTNGLRSTQILGTERVTHATSMIQSWFESTIDKVINDLKARFPDLETWATMMIDRPNFLTTVQKTLGKRFSALVHDQLEHPPIDNPLYNITSNQLSLYDGLSLLTYNNHNKAQKRTVDGVNESYRQVEAIIGHYQLPENHVRVTA